jgi:hypothetical protein
MSEIVRARLVLYAPGEYGLMYDHSDGGISGRFVENIDDAIQEIAKYNRKSAAALVIGAPISDASESGVRP